MGTVKFILTYWRYINNERQLVTVTCDEYETIAVFAKFLKHQKKFGSDDFTIENFEAVNDNNEKQVVR